jgi:hypothetical protein
MVHTHHADAPHGKGSRSAEHAHAPLPGPSHEGSVLLDIGADTGALIIHTTAAQDGLEIHVSPADRPGQRTHAAVRPRHLPDRTAYAAVITPLPEGEYTVWDGNTVHGTVTVDGGHVSEYPWA